MKRMLKITLVFVLAVVMCAACTISSLAADEPVVYYFVDCGDYLTDTVSEGDSFGQYNSVTDQFFGADPSTGKQWGVVDEAYDETSSTSYGDSRVNTTWTWAYEYNTAATDVPKEQSNRYCRNMSENGLDRVITYKFELPEDGQYVVEVGFACPWGNSSPVDIYLNGELIADTIMIDSGSSAYGYGTVSPVDGFITVEAKSIQPTINMAYIVVSDKLTNEETTAWEDIEYKPVTDGDTDEVTDATTTKDDGNHSNDVNDNATNAAEETNSDSKTKSGCGSTVGACSVVFAMTVGMAVVIKKKRK